MTMKLELELQKKEEEYELMHIDNSQTNNTIDEYDEIIKNMKQEFENELNRLHKYYQSKLEHNLQEKSTLDKELNEKQNEINELLLKIKSLNIIIQTYSKSSQVLPSKSLILQNTTAKTARFLSDKMIFNSPVPTLLQYSTNFQNSNGQQNYDANQSQYYANRLSCNIEKSEQKTNNIADIKQMKQKMK